MVLGDASRAHIFVETGIIPILGKVFRNASWMEAVFTSPTDEHVQIMASYLATSILV